MHTVKASIHLNFQISILWMCLLHWYQTGIWLQIASVLLVLRRKYLRSLEQGEGEAPTATAAKTGTRERKKPQHDTSLLWAIPAVTFC